MTVRVCVLSAFLYVNMILEDVFIASQYTRFHRLNYSGKQITKIKLLKQHYTLHNHHIGSNFQQECN
jgi:hypothetical protein